MLNIFQKHNNEKMLPVFFPPPIVDYLHFAHYLSIILSNSKHENWFYANFINICYNMNADQKLNFHMLNQFDCHPSYFVDTYRLHNKIMDINKINIINDIINWIDKGYYVKIKVDSKLIPNNYMYNSKQDFLLHVFIYGYNKEKNIFYTHNFDLNRSYSIIEVSFDDIEKAFYSDRTKKIINNVPYMKKREQAEDYFIVLYTLNSNIKDCYDFSFYLEKIKNSLVQYIKGENVVSSNSEIIRLNDIMDYNENDFHWGLNVYDGIMKKVLFNYNIYHGLFEHKSIMLKRLDLLRDKNVLKTDEFSTKYREVVDIAKQLRMYCIKVTLKNKTSKNNKVSRDKIIEGLNNMKIKEKLILSNVIEGLDTYLP
jgi:hypothetical protein